MKSENTHLSSEQHEAISIEAALEAFEMEQSRKINCRAFAKALDFIITF